MLNEEGGILWTIKAAILRLTIGQLAKDDSLSESSILCSYKFVVE